MVRLCGDEIAKALVVALNDLAYKVSGHVQIGLRGRQTNVPEVGGEQREFSLEVCSVFVPSQQP